MQNEKHTEGSCQGAVKSSGELFYGFFFANSHIAAGAKGIIIAPWARKAQPVHHFVEIRAIFSMQKRILKNVETFYLKKNLRNVSKTFLKRLQKFNILC